jgi:hypothetical protein
MSREELGITEDKSQEKGVSSPHTLPLYSIYFYWLLSSEKIYIKR